MHASRRDLLLHHSGVRVAIALFLIALPLPSGAAVTVRITGVDDAATAVTITAFDGADPSQKRTAAASGGEARLELAPQRVWYVRARAPGYWSGEQAVYVTSGDQTLEAVLRPAGSIAATLRNVPRDARRVHVRFTAAGGGEPAGDLTCVLESQRFTCPLPAGHLDVNFAVRGTAYVYRWNVDVAPAALVDLGTIALVPGASIVGLVDASRIRSTPAVLEVSLRGVHGEGEIARTRPAGNGFFQFTGIIPGEYVIGVVPRKGAAVTARDVVAQSGAEATLARPLVVDLPRSLDGTITPPVGADGRAWRLELWDRALRVEPAARAIGSAAGAFSLKSVAAGTYDLLLRDAEGNTWIEQEVTIDGRAGPPVHLDAGIMRVEGAVRVGTQPLTGTIFFGGRYGTPRVALAARSGLFRGALPVTESAWIVTIEGDDPPIDRTISGVRPALRDGGTAWIDLQLAGGTIEGSVVDERGQPLRKAIVTVETSDGTLSSQTESRDEGAFRVGGLADASYVVSAQTADGESARNGVVLSGGRADPLRIIVQKVQWLRGIVRSRRGVVPGASVTAFSEQDPAYGAAAVDTDAQGRFAARLPRGSRAAQVFIAAPGYGCAMQRVALEPEPPLFFVDGTGTALTLRYRTAAAVELRGGGSAIHPEFWLHDCPDARKEGGETTTLHLPRFAPGEYALCEPRGRCVTAVLVPGGSAVLDLTAR